MSTAESSRYRLDKQVALITGAAQGLGFGMARELALLGASVIIADVQEQKARNAADQLRGEGLAADAVALDITRSGDVDRVFASVAGKYGRLDIVVNNAGVGQTVTPIVEISDDEWDRVLRVTLTGTFYCCRAAGRIMEKQERGSIVNISSINGLSPAALVASYNAAKAAVISLTKTLSLELAAYGVRVNAVCPGPVYTEFNKTVMAQRCKSLGISEDEMIDRVRKAIPLGRWGEAADIAGVVAFLSSPAAGWITGEVYRASGGLEGVSAAPGRRKPAQ